MLIYLLLCAAALFALSRASEKPVLSGVHNQDVMNSLMDSPNSSNLTQRQLCVQGNGPLRSASRPRNLVQVHARGEKLTDASRRQRHEKYVTDLWKKDFRNNIQNTRELNKLKLAQESEARVQEIGTRVTELIQEIEARAQLQVQEMTMEREERPSNGIDESMQRTNNLMEKLNERYQFIS